MVRKKENSLRISLKKELGKVMNFESELKKLIGLRQKLPLQYIA